MIASLFEEHLSLRLFFDPFGKDLKVKVSALQEIMDFSLENKIIDVKVEAKKVLWDKAPQTP